VHHIKWIQVKNFRSIVREELRPDALTVIVGENDSGKSNVLRALNLFFNNETDPGRPFNFAADFSNRATVGKGKARQVEVALDIEPPDSYADRSLIRWRRAWRDSEIGYAWQDIKRLSDGSSVTGRSRVIPWLQRIRFKYVPAIKGQDYFATLLRDLHDVLAETVDNELRHASADFIGSIRSHTAQITQLIQEALGMDSKLQLPSNLRQLFEVLDFETSTGETLLSLQQRGDGVKVRHIPAILKFLADQEKRLANKGRVRPTAIWGYEEPENNLEFTRAFKHAEELLSFSKEIQIFATTHSPAFYSLIGRSPQVKGLAATQSREGATTLTELDPDSLSQLDEGLGLMPLVAPYVAQKAKQLSDAEILVQGLTTELANVKKPVVLVAGETDAAYVEAALREIAPELAKKVTVRFIGEAGTDGARGGGDSNLLRFVGELLRKPDLLSRKLLVLLDCDVEQVPTSPAPTIVFKKLPQLPNGIAKRGIENLLPEELFVDTFYSVKEKTDEYGGVTTIKKLNKKSLCASVCDGSVDLVIPRADLFANFSCIEPWIEELLAE
jgi:hypothetical protein